MRTHLFLFLAFLVFVMLGGSAEAQNRIRKVEKSEYVEQKKDVKEKAPLNIERKRLKSQAKAKIPKRKVKISYEGLFTRAVKRGKGRVSSVFQDAQPRRLRKTLTSTKRGEKIEQGYPSVDSDSQETLNQKIGKSPATFTNKGVISFKRAKKHIIRSRSSLESERK